MSLLCPPGLCGTVLSGEEQCRKSMYAFAPAHQFSTVSCAARGSAWPPSILWEHFFLLADPWLHPVSLLHWSLPAGQENIPPARRCPCWAHPGAVLICPDVLHLLQVPRRWGAAGHLPQVTASEPHVSKRSCRSFQTTVGDGCVGVFTQPLTVKVSSYSLPRR